MKKPLSFFLLILALIVLMYSCSGDIKSNTSSSISTKVSDKKVDVQSILNQMEKSKFKEGELLVKFKSGLLASSISKVHQTLGTTVLRSYNIIPTLELVKIPTGMSIKEAIISYMADPAVEYAEPNYIRKAVETIPNDQYFSQQWALLNKGNFASGTAGADIKATLAWDIHKGDSSIIVAILDTGIDYNHSDLSGNIWINPGEIPNNGIDDDGNGKIDDWRGWNFITNSNNPLDDNGHGTHVIGIIGAKGNNSIGITGLMWNVKLMALKILDKNGEGSVADEISAIQYAISMGAKIINASYSGDTYVNAEYDAISMANSAGVLFIAAAGNGGEDEIGDNNDFRPQYPANYPLPNIISVAATDQNDIRASFSNFGINSVHVAAPGVYIISTVPTSLFSTGYAFANGTSSATPHVSALAGLLYSYYPYFTYSQIRATILRYVDILPSLSGFINTGGRINAYRAISSLLTPTSLNAQAISPTQVALQWIDNATGEDGYYIERKESSGTFSQIASISVNSTNFTDSSLKDGTSYSYRVRAFNSIPAQSRYSNEVTTITPLQTPTNLVANAISPTQINLSWVDNSKTESGYKIERKILGSGDFVQIATVGANVTSYSDTGLTPFTTYFYRVRAFNSVAGDSPYSVEVSATTPKEASGGGGGGCSIRVRRDSNFFDGDILIVLIPLIYLLYRRFYKFNKK
ncbi:MAG: S8 family serine peptidase [Thermodesulfovibrionales bacterium]|nr:S8 family serine peptidase [Thermodesulfovibrionales bacterium]